MKKLLYINFLWSSLFFSQIKLNIKVINTKEVDKGKLLEINIVNESNVDYILPIDTTDFRTFYPSEYCLNLFESDKYQDFMLKINIIDEDDSASLIAFPNYKITGQIDENSKHYIKEINKRDSLLKLEDREIKLWKEKNKIQQSNFWIKNNKSIISNMIFLKAKHQVKIYKYFNPNKFNLDLISGNYDYFNLIPDHQYKLSLKYCIENNIYKYLTEEQLNKIKGYKLFFGSLESNKIEFKQ